MVDEFMVCVDRMIASTCFDPGNDVGSTATTDGGGGLEGRRAPSGSGGSGHGAEGEEGCSSNNKKKKKERKERSGMGKMIATECRICQEEGEESDMEAPCACNGTLKFAHRKCIQKWCNKKGDITCEICNQVYAPNYSIPPRRSNTDGFTIDIRQGWDQQIDLSDPHFLAIASAERELLGAEYDDYSMAHNNGIACCRSFTLILILLLLIRHAIMVTWDSAVAEDSSSFFSVSILQLASILLPCYIVMRSCYIVQNRRRRQAYLRQVWG